MTRINVVPVEELTDNFILAEYFELPRVYILVEKHMRKNHAVMNMDIPPTYRLGKGHVLFFYDKLKYLVRRSGQLWQEGTKRGLKLQQDPSTEGYQLLWFVDGPLWNDYIPTPEAIQLNWDRLQVRRRYEGGSYSSK